jgi:plasmid stability protein
MHEYGAQVSTNVRLPAELFRELKARAYREGRSVAAVLRDAVARYLHGEPGSARDPLAEFIGSFDSGVGDLGAEHDHYLYGVPKKRGEATDVRAADRHQRTDHPRRPRRRKT